MGHGMKSKLVLMSPREILAYLAHLSTTAPCWSAANEAANRKPLAMQPVLFFLMITSTINQENLSKTLAMQSSITHRTCFIYTKILKNGTQIHIKLN